MRVPDTAADRTGFEARRSAKMVASKATDKEDSLLPAFRQRLLLAKRFNFPPHVAALVAQLAFEVGEARQ